MIVNIYQDSFNSGSGGGGSTKFTPLDGFKFSYWDGNAVNAILPRIENLHNIKDWSYMLYWVEENVDGNAISALMPDAVKPTSLKYAFARCNVSDLSEIIKKIDTSELTALDYTFQNANIDTLNLSHWDVSNVTSINSIAALCSATTLNLSGCDFSNVADVKNTYSPFRMPNLVNIITDEGTKLPAIDLSGLGLYYAPNLTRESVLNVLNALPNMSDTTNIYYIYFNTASESLVTEEEIATLATAKRWVVEFK